jgi:hypothetical protein
MLQSRAWKRFELTEIACRELFHNEIAFEFRHSGKSIFMREITNDQATQEHN